MHSSPIRMLLVTHSIKIILDELFHLTTVSLNKRMLVACRQDNVHNFQELRTDIFVDYTEMWFFCLVFVFCLLLKCICFVIAKVTVFLPIDY